VQWVLVVAVVVGLEAVDGLETGRPDRSDSRIDSLSPFNKERKQNARLTVIDVKM